MGTTPSAYLEDIHSKMMVWVGSDDFIKSDIDKNEKAYLDEILDKSESSKGVLTVLVTSLVYKIFHPQQDVRKHQSSITGGYSGRTFDSKYITPFLKSVRFPAMAESGWLTRSLEQKVPYDQNYSGAIQPNTLKTAFLSILENVECGANCEEYLLYLFQGLIIKRNKQTIELAKPINLPIEQIIRILIKHFNSNYIAEGASRLPTLALYAAYQCLMNETKRFEGKRLQSLESHTSADKRSGRIGDIDIVDENERPFEAVEVKHGILISLQLVRDAFQKFVTTQVSRYYLLSTSDVNEIERVAIQQEIERIRNVHGCQVIVNGVIESLKYYLRLLSITSEFIHNYVELLENDAALKFEHKKRWNELIANG
jgi:DNA (cytosine-5)-methyltransferase 1